ncbi:MAG: response regulator [Anaerolineae bacterium]|nr:response regulator [Anaerolineae bacterium]
MADKSHILIVEDDLDLSEMLNAYFRVQGYEVQTAAWGEDAVRLTQEEPPDLVVLDIRLPDIDGYEVCRRVRQHRRTQDVPIIFLTEKRDRVDKLTGLELGVVDYITKPFDIQELRLRVRNALQRARQTSVLNPVTNMPEGQLVEEKLGALLLSDENWSVLLMTIVGLDGFRELYGFVASDDVLRAVSLMMNNAVREFGSDTDFIGHLAPHDFIIITNQDHVVPIRERIETRLRESMAYFYPLKDRDKAKQAMEENRLKLVIGQVGHTSGPFDDLKALKQAVLDSHEDKD